MFFISVVVDADAWPRPTVTNFDILRMVYASDILDVDPKKSIYNMANITFGAGIVRTHM